MNKLRDIEGNYKSLIEKMVKLEFEARELGLTSVADGLKKPLSEAPDNAKLIGDSLHTVELEKNRISQEGK